MDDIAKLYHGLDDRIVVLTKQMEDLFRLLGGRMKGKEEETDRRFRSGVDAVAGAEAGGRSIKRPIG